VRPPENLRWCAARLSAVAKADAARGSYYHELRRPGDNAAVWIAAQIAEFLVLGALAGLLAAAGATAVGWLLAERVFQIPFTVNPMLWAYGIFGAALAVAAAGWLGTRATVRQPPLAVLRQLG